MAGAIGSLFGDVSLRTEGLAKGIRKANNMLYRFGRNATQAGKTIGVGLGVPLVGIGASSIKAFTTMETGLKEVKTLLPQMDSSEFKTLSNGVRELSIEFGTDLPNNINAMYQALSAGVPSGNILEFMKVASKSSIAGVTDTATAVDGLTNVINAFGLDFGDAMEISDKMFNTLKDGKTTFQELSQSMFQSAPVAASLGIEFDEVMASVVAITKTGAPTKQAMTMIKAALSNMQKPTAQMTLALRNLGYETGRALISDVGMIKAFEMLATQSGLTAQEADKIFGSVEGLQAILSMTGKNAHVVADALKSIENASGSTEVAFKEMSTALGFQINRVKEQFRALAISLTEENIDTIKKFVDNVNVFIEKYGKLVAKILLFVAPITAVTVAIAGTVFVLGLLATGLKAVIGLFMLIGLKVTLIVGAIILVTTAFIKLNNKFKIIKKIADFFTKLGINMRREFKIINASLEAMGEKIKLTFETAKKRIQIFFQTIKNIGVIGKMVAEKFGEAFKGMFVMIGDLAKAVFTNILDPKQMKKEIAEVFANLGDDVDLKPVRAKLKEFREQTAQEIANLNKEVTEKTANINAQFSAKFKEANITAQKEFAEMGKAVEKVTDKVNDLKDTVSGKKSKDSGSPKGVKKKAGLFGEMATKFKEQATQIGKDTVIMSEDMGAIVENLSNGMTDSFQNFFNGTKAGFRDLVGDILKQFQRLVIQRKIINPILGALGNAIGIPDLTGTTAPKVATNANGGLVRAGVPSIVGERGMELFVPQSHGRIVPNHALAGGGGVNVHFNVNATDAQSFDAKLAQRENMIVGMIEQAFRRNGKQGIL